MTTQTIEQKFLAFKQSVKPAEFNSIEFLSAKAQQLEADDAALSARIMVRVVNLKKQGESVKSEGKRREESGKVSAGAEAKERSDKTLELDTLKAKRTVNFYLLTFNYISKHAFIAFVLIPTLLFAFYQCFWATERYESQAQVIVQQPDAMATMDAGLAILSGMGVSSGGSDTELVKAYIYSNDMVRYLNETLELRAHYSQESIDYFSRIHEDDTQETMLEFYQNHITVDINEKSGVITIYSQAFDPDYANSLTKTITEKAEWYINSIGHQLAEAQLEFIKGEHQLVEDKLKDAQTKLLKFQQRYNLLDPTAEGMAMQQITYTIESQIAIKQTELKTLKSIMSGNAPQVRSAENELRALKAQLKTERSKLAQAGEKEIPVSEILSRFTDYKVKMELALQAYTSSQISLEKSRIEAYKQMKYLIVVESATKPEENKYPEVFYNISLFLLLLSVTFGITKIIYMTIKELK
ncbi:lipopolysaccharide biosynthesis protein [Vibrio sp. 10N.222.51.C5]|uniref:lipopolysaccharide biosynthesis protein n=1 Tax=Vibrio sp. 10N.222.51.C5 TaxID=3229623 RepID=UPI003553FDA3